MNDAMKDLEEVVKSAKGLVGELLGKKPEKMVNASDLPRVGGVYVVYEKGVAIYVGKARNLYQRICRDHLSAERAGKGSAFQRSLHSRDQTPFGPPMRTWILNNCYFAYLPIRDADMRGLVEALAIAVHRTPALLNKQ